MDAGKWALPRVSAYVPLEVAILRECSGTQVALEGLACVFVTVRCHFPPFLGHISALRARMQSASYVHGWIVPLRRLPRRETRFSVNPSAWVCATVSRLFLPYLTMRADKCDLVSISSAWHKERQKVAPAGRCPSRKVVRCNQPAHAASERTGCQVSQIKCCRVCSLLPR